MLLVSAVLLFQTSFLIVQGLDLCCPPNGLPDGFPVDWFEQVIERADPHYLGSNAQIGFACHHDDLDVRVRLAGMPE